MSLVPSAPLPVQVASDVTTLTRKLKVHIPGPLLAVAGWPTGVSPLPLVAEAKEAGWLRLHLDANVRSRIDAKRSEIEGEDSPDKMEYLATFDDRYRAATLYRSANSFDVLLTYKVASHLRISMVGNRDVYLEAHSSVIDLMSPEYRSKRLRELEDDTSI